MNGSPQSYTQFAAWLQRVHPDVFAKLLANVQKLSGLSALYRGRFAGRREASRNTFGDYEIDLSSLADAIGPADYAPMDFSITDAISADTAGAELSPMGLTAGSVSAPTYLTQDQIPTLTTASPSSSASSVGNFLSNLATPQVALAALRAATTIVTSNNAANVITAQANRAAAGQAPANVSYIPVTDSSTGIVTAQPVLNTSNGQLPLSASGINSLAPATFLQNYGLYIMLGLAALVFATSE